MQRTFCDICDAAMDTQANAVVARMRGRGGEGVLVTVTASARLSASVPAGVDARLDVCGGCMRKALEIYDHGSAAP